MCSEPFPRRILLAVTGLSPQVVTETLYALAVEKEPAFVPTEIHLITTQEGAERARLSLLSGDPGWFHRLCADYGLRGVRFDATRIHVLEDPRGRPLGDIRTPADNESAADFITEQVRRLTADEESVLHVSIAGGRKTMGYYLGYALSLYGRPRDRLSHVLVSPRYESHPHFFYPTPYSRVIHTPPPDSRPIDTRDARVTLAEIPFVRLRDGLERDLLEGRAGFSTVVAEAQRALPPQALELDPAGRTLTAGGETFPMRPAGLALYWMLAERVLDGRGGVHWSDPGIERELLAYYGRIVGPDSGDYERAEQAYARGLTPENFDPAKAHIKQTLLRHLGQRRAAPYLIKPLERIPDSRYRRYGLDLPKAVVRVRGGRLEAADAVPRDALRGRPERPDSPARRPRP